MITIQKAASNVQRDPASLHTFIDTMNCVYSPTHWNTCSTRDR